MIHSMICDHMWIVLYYCCIVFRQQHVVVVFFFCKCGTPPEAFFTIKIIQHQHTFSKCRSWTGLMFSLHNKHDCYEFMRSDNADFYLETSPLHFHQFRWKFSFRKVNCDDWQKPKLDIIYCTCYLTAVMLESLLQGLFSLICALTLFTRGLCFNTNAHQR